MSTLLDTKIKDNHIPTKQIPLKIQNRIRITFFFFHSGDLPFNKSPSKDYFELNFGFPGNPVRTKTVLPPTPNKLPLTSANGMTQRSDGLAAPLL